MDSTGCTSRRVAQLLSHESHKIYCSYHGRTGLSTRAFHTTHPAASEITEIRNAVSGLKGALDAMRSNTDVAATNMLKLTLREARDQLGRRLQEVSPATATDPTVASATREGRILLDEVNAMFF